MRYNINKSREAHQDIGKYYKTSIKLVMFYGIGCWALKKHIHKMSTVEIGMLR